MTWKVLYKTFNDDVLHLTGNESFILRSGVVHFSNGTQVPLVADSSEEAAPTKLVEAETSKLLKAIKRAKRTNTASKAVKWAAVGGFLVASLLVINGALIQKASGPLANLESGPEWDPSSSTFELPTGNPELSIQQQAPVADQPRLEPTPIEPTAADAEIAAGIQGGAGRGDVTVTLGPDDAEQTLYVFADPLCPHCQTLEPVLHELADAGMKIEIFPVSVIGGTDSIRRASAALCQTGQDRSDIWKAVASGNDFPADTTDAACEAGNASVDTNNQFFRAAGFSGTPTLVNKQGQQPPANVSRDKESIQEWLSS